MAPVLDKLDLELKEAKKIDRLINKVDINNESRVEKSKSDKTSSSR